MKIAVVTGASSGMGREFVREIEKNESLDEIWVIARRRERLEELQASVQTPLRVLPLDLTETSSIVQYKELLEKEKPQVHILVNGSGCGKFGHFSDIPLEAYDRMIDLNAKALIRMTYVTLPFMQAGAMIYNIDSLSSFQPVPYINVYGATKALVLSFSRALGAELKDKKIRVMAVCPGWVDTEFFSHAVVDDTVTYYNRIFQPQDVAKRAVRDMKKGKDLSILGASVRAQVFFTKLLPHKLVMRIWMNQQKKHKNEDKIKH